VIQAGGSPNAIAAKLATTVETKQIAIHRCACRMRALKLRGMRFELVSEYCAQFSWPIENSLLSMRLLHGQLGQRFSKTEIFERLEMPQSGARTTADICLILDDGQFLVA
jgi:hypothetical protein